MISERMEDHLFPLRADPQPGTSPSGLGTRGGEEFGVNTAQFSSRVLHTHTLARAHTHSHTHTHTREHAHTRAHPRTQARVRAAGSKLCALVRSLPPPPLESSRGYRGRRGGNNEVFGSGEGWMGSAFSPLQVLGAARRPLDQGDPN